MKKIVPVAFYVISVVASFSIGSNLALRNNWAAFKVQLEAMQSELALRHLLRYNELVENLERGCTAAVIDKLRISVAMESSLIATTLEQQQTSDLSQYIAKQSPGLETKLAGYKNPYGSAWTEPECK